MTGAGGRGGPLVTVPAQSVGDCSGIFRPLYVPLIAAGNLPQLPVTLQVTGYGSLYAPGSVY